MMLYIFITIYSISLSYFLLKKRSVDMFTILFGGLFYYSIPLLMGKITLTGVVINQDVNYIVYIIYSFVFIVSFSFMYVNDKKKVKVIRVEKQGYLDKPASRSLFFFTMIVFLFFLIGVFQMGFSNYFFTANKSINEDIPTLISISVVFSMIMLPVSLYYQKIISLIIFFLILLSLLLYGSRSYFVIAMISSVFILFNFKEVRLIKKAPLLIVGIFFAVSMAVFKFVYQIIKSASLSELISNVKKLDSDSIISQLLGDPMAVIYNLNYTINNDISLSMNYFIHRFLSAVPGGGDFFSSLIGIDFPRYSSILGNEYTTVHWGLASSIYAELIAISGFAGFCVVYLLINKLTFDFNNSIKLKGLNFFNLIFISAYSYLLFYSHRLDITFVLGIFKYSVILWIIFKFILKKKRKEKMIKPI